MSDLRQTVPLVAAAAPCALAHTLRRRLDDDTAATKNETQSGDEDPNDGVTSLTRVLVILGACLVGLIAFAAILSIAVVGWRSRRDDATDDMDDSHKWSVVSASSDKTASSHTSSPRPSPPRVVPADVVVRFAAADENPRQRYDYARSWSSGSSPATSPSSRTAGRAHEHRLDVGRRHASLPPTTSSGSRSGAPPVAV